jgi:hypothetical protein
MVIFIQRRSRPSRQGKLDAFGSSDACVYILAHSDSHHCLQAQKQYEQVLLASIKLQMLIDVQLILLFRIKLN